MIRIEVNGRAYEREVEPRRTLADFLRDDLNLTGTHVACEHGFCGSCNVLRRRRGDPLVPDVRRPGRRPLGRDRRRHLAAPDGTLSELQQAFTEHHALQCGFCTPAMLLTATEFLRDHPGRDERRGDPRGDRRRHLPLHRLPADRRGHPVRGGEGVTIEQHPGAAKIASDTAQKEAARKLARQEHQPRRGSPLPARRGPLHRRHQAREHGARGDRAQPARARAHRLAIDTSKAEALPGVIRVVTGADVAEHAAPLPSFGAGPIVQDMIAIEKVRHYGEAVAAVIAEDRYIAEDACDLIEVEYEPLPVVLDPFEAQKDGAPLVHEKLETNVAYARTFSFGEVDRAFEEAPRKVQAKLRWPRSTGMPMDTNGAIGDYDAGTGVVTIYANSMNFTYFHWLIAGSLKIPTSKLRVVPIAAGGSFGSKFFMHKVPTFAGFLVEARRAAR